MCAFSTKSSCYEMQNTCVYNFAFVFTGEQDPNENRIVHPLEYTSHPNLTDQKDASLYCQVVVFHLADLMMCYRFENESSIEVMKNNFYGGRCAVCPFDQYGSCNNQIEDKEHWSISQKGFGTCNENRFVILNISKATHEDNGITVFCGYHINAMDTNVLAEFDITVSNPPFDWELFAFCSLGVIILIIILITSFIMILCCINRTRLIRKKKYRDEMKRRRSKRLRSNLYSSVEDSSE